MTRRQVTDLDPLRHRPHPLHAADRIFPETNCAADLWIECLASLGLDPVPGLAFTLGTDFDGDQWRMFTFPAEDLRRLFGIEMDELNVWRPLGAHLEDQLELGNMVIVDVDAWHLPDTAGLTYHCAHQKTSIMVQMLDRGSGRLGYFHNTGYYELGGEDFSAVVGAEFGPDRAALPPFALSVRLGGMRTDAEAAGAEALALAAEHLARRPAGNPVEAMGKRVAHDLPWLRSAGLEAYHRYAFGSLRQCGANAELAARFATWLAGFRGPAPLSAAAGFLRVAEAMKRIEFSLARAVRGRPTDPELLFADPATHWAEAHRAIEEVA